jgi:predicted AAA+ superfamily ATPase
MTDYRLSSFDACLATLVRRLREPSPGRVQLLAGPRQVGKTTLLVKLQEHFGNAATYVAADSPEAALPGFWERLWAETQSRSRKNRTILLIDEIQHLPDWNRRLKAEYDRVHRLKLRVHVVASGSSALHLGRGSRETLAGRFERVVLTHWSAADLATRFGFSEQTAARHAVLSGTYPGSFAFIRDRERWLAYVRDSIMEPAIGRDILALTEVRKPALLRQVFAIAAASPAQIMSLQKIQGALHDRGALETIAHYLHLLEDAFLVAPIAKHAARLARQRAAPPKLVTLNNALCAAADPRGTPDPESDPQRFGTWLENACLALAWNSGQRVTYWREEPLEVDAITTGSWGQWALEVKTGLPTARDLAGLFEFTRRYPGFTALLVCEPTAIAAAARLGVAATTWVDFLNHGPPAARRK